MPRNSNLLPNILNLFFLLHCFVSLAPLFSQSPNQSPGELIVKLRGPAKLSKRSADGRYEIISSAVTTTLQNSGLYELAPALPENFLPELGEIVLVRFADQYTDLSAAINDLTRHPEVEYVQPNHVFALDAPPTLRATTIPMLSSSDELPNDSLFISQWALQTIRAPEAWRITAGDPNVLIAIIDTGIDYTHPDLRDGLWINPGEDRNGNGVADSLDFNGIDDDGNGFVDDIHGWDFTDAPNFPDGGDYRDRDNHPEDEQGHGTAVAGVIAATANNRIGIAGLAHGCRLVNLRAGTSRGWLEEDDIASAIVYAVMIGARVINMSFGDALISPMLREVIHFAHARGVALVASAGNAADDAPFYPAGLAETIAVGASTRADQLAGFSNFGAAVDVVAPGTEIWTTHRGGGYGIFSGTSAAAPFVSAVAGLLLSHSPHLNNEMVRAALTNSARDLGERGWDRFFGAGRIDAAAALRLEQVACAEIHFPQMDMGFAGSELVIRGTALGAFVTGYELSYGMGNDPTAWTVINHTENRQVLSDSLGVWSLANLNDGIYTLRLSVEQQTGQRFEDKIRVFLDRTPPRIGQVKMTPMIDGNLHSVLIEFTTDDLCRTILWWRQNGNAGAYSPLPLNYITDTHRINFSQTLARGEIEFFLEAINRAGLRTINNNNGQDYFLSLSAPEVSTAPFVEIAFKKTGNPFEEVTAIPAGWLLPAATDFDNDGFGELILSIYEANHRIGPITIFERIQNDFVKRFATERAGIPRDVGDGDGDGLAEILVGVGPKSFIYEAAAPGAFPSILVWADTNDFWASRYADLDGDGRREIIGRIGELFTVWENVDDNQYQLVTDLPNFTGGANATGIPHSEIGDFDGDGHHEILFGDFDGDLYIYEATGDNQYTATWSDSLPLLDSIDFIRAGDFDGDGRLDFAAGCHSSPEINFEHEFDARYWLFRIYRATGDNLYEPFWEQAFFGFQPPKDFDAGIGAGDIDNDGRDELFLNLFPDGYVVDVANGEATVVWHYPQARSNTTVVANLNKVALPEFYFSDGKILRAFRLPGAQDGAPPPREVEAHSLDASRVLLTWQPVAGAESFVIYRGIGNAPLQYLTLTSKNVFLDTSLTTEQLYRYAVATIDLQRQPIAGPFSNEVVARPSKPPVVVAAHFIAPHHLTVLFDEPMHESIGQTALFRVDQLIPGAGHTTVSAHGLINLQPESVVISRSGGEVLLSFSQVAFAPGTYQVRIDGATDVNRVPIDTTRNRAQFIVAKEQPRFYVVSAQLESPRQILIHFNMPVEIISATQSENYRIKVFANMISSELFFAQAAIAENDSAGVRLTLATGVLGSLGRNYLLEIAGVHSRSGIPLRRGEGDAIGFAMANQNLDHVLIYPNPFLADRHTQITIAGLTRLAVVKILDIEGRVLTTLEESDGNGGVDWDARDSNGRLLPSGVYLCYVTSNTQSTVTKFVIVR